MASKLTKYDVIDVLLVCLFVSYLPMILISLFMQAGMIIQFVFNGLLLDTMMFVVVFFQAGYLIATVLVLYLILAKRSVIIPKMFPASEQKEITLSDSLVMLTRYSFWVRLFGMITVLRYATNLITGITQELSRSTIAESAQQLRVPGMEHLVGVVLGVLILWKADWIADVLKKIGANTTPYTTSEIAADKTKNANNDEEDTGDTQTDK